MKSALKLLYLITTVIYLSINASYANNNQVNDYNIKKSWIDIPHESFISNIIKDKKLNRLVKEYHRIQKRRLENFQLRINMLNKISQYNAIILTKIKKNTPFYEFDQMVKRKAWYLEEVKRLYLSPNEDFLNIFYQTTNNKREKIYLKNSIEYDFNLSTYWGMFALEMIDPCKRMLTPQYYKWLQYYKKEYPHFFAWLEGEDITFRTPQTKVLNDREMENYKVKFSKGYAYHSHSNKLLTTEDPNEYIYIITPFEEMYVIESSDSIKHTSLSGGKPLFASGSIRVNNGQIIYISEESGHYRPNANILQKVIVLLKKTYKVNISNMRVSYRSSDNIINEKAQDFIIKKLDKVKIPNIKLFYNYKY